MKRTLGRVLVFLLCISVLFAIGSAICGHFHQCIGEDCQFCHANSYLQKLYRIFLLGFICLSLETVVFILFSNVNLYCPRKKQSVNLVVNKIKLSI
ncbi:MAG: hypothetical protein IJ944_02305 [Clostridia bacterium]|nr:hypothetical protein [Clostridia bacterium]